MSNRERIARAAEEARLSEAEKASVKAAKPAKAAKATKARSKRAAKAPARMKIVWEVCNGGGKVLKTFAYPDKAAAEAATEALSSSTGNTHLMRPTKVPMD